MKVSNNKCTFVSKKKLIENYENIIKRKDESIRSLTISNKSLLIDNGLLNKDKIRTLKDIVEIETENNDLKQAKNILDELIEELVTVNQSIFNKEIERLERIKARTKKIKIKIKCENRILDIKEKCLAEEIS